MTVHVCWVIDLSRTSGAARSVKELLMDACTILSRPVTVRHEAFSDQQDTRVGRSELPFGKIAKLLPFLMLKGQDARCTARSGQERQRTEKFPY
jgi:hypothetical protein